MISTRGRERECIIKRRYFKNRTLENKCNLQSTNYKTKLRLLCLLCEIKCKLISRKNRNINSNFNAVLFTCWWEKEKHLWSIAQLNQNYFELNHTLLYCNINK